MCFVLISAQVSAQQEPDIYDRIDAIAESLRVWSVNPPTTVTDEETLSLEELFIGAEIMHDDSTNSSRITMPVYMGILTTELIQYHSSADSLTVWTIPLEAETDHIIIDGKRYPCPSEVLVDSLAIDYITNRVTSLRTMGLPTVLQPISIDLPDSVTVKLRGRDSRWFDFTSGVWHNTLSYLASGMQTYAGLMSVEKDTSGLIAKYYILLTMPEARGHHFLTITDQVDMKDNKVVIMESRVKLLPYIRTDNLKELFDTSSEHEDRPKWEIQIDD
ncbi:MAG: hypothetical protein HQ568_05855 [Calditrichaeota bacterium]|nr:hypothetical protein [Calditrichota bacterium]